MPPEASSIAGKVDTLFYSLLAFSVALGLFLAGLIITYAVKYRAGSAADRTGQRGRNLALEIGWTGGSLAIAFVFFAWGAELSSNVTNRRPTRWR